jgi:hypothetical protein
VPPARRVAPRPFPSYPTLPTPPTTAPPTENTANFEFEESFSLSGKVEKDTATPDHLNLDSRDSFLHQTLHKFDLRSFRPDAGQSQPVSNPHLLRTHPIPYIPKIHPMHAHTQSYDINYANPAMAALPQYT